MNACVYVSRNMRIVRLSMYMLVYVLGCDACTCMDRCMPCMLYVCMYVCTYVCMYGCVYALFRVSLHVRMCHRSDKHKHINNTIPSIPSWSWTLDQCITLFHTYPLGITPAIAHTELLHAHHNITQHTTHAYIHTYIHT